MKLHECRVQLYESINIYILNVGYASDEMWVGVQCTNYYVCYVRVINNPKKYIMYVYMSQILTD